MILHGYDLDATSRLSESFQQLQRESAGKLGLKAVTDRGGIPKLRCLHARQDPEVRIEVHLADSVGDPEPAWRYQLGFKPEGKGAQQLLVTEEKVFRRGRPDAVLLRPSLQDKSDRTRLTQTYIENVQANAEFREIAGFFSEVLYLHVVPQLLKFGDQIGGQQLDNDPFGQGLLEQVAGVPEKVRASRLGRIEHALKLAIPQFGELKFVRDEVTSRPHLEVRYQHHRPNAGWQREDQWSDGTLRLFGLFWSLLGSNALLLLEEPEQSLNSAIVGQIPTMLHQLQRDSKRRRQVLISTHSDALLENRGIDGRSVLRLSSGSEGSTVSLPDEPEMAALRAGLSVAEVILPKTRPRQVEQLRLF